MIGQRARERAVSTTSRVVYHETGARCVRKQTYMRVAAPLMAVVCATSAVGQEAPSANRLNALSLVAFADGFLPPEMTKRHIPGAVLAVVHEGRVVLVRGFGFADLESRRKVDPDRTRFSLGSVTKVVTATAALQLVERGQLDLTADVNTRLRTFQLRPYRGSSATLHDLLTHTAGFEERLTGIFCTSEDEREPLATYLAKSMPHRFARAGEVLSYSNHGMSLVALLVEQVSGQQFDEYVGEQILAPLHMRRSGFLPTAEGAPHMATAYQFADGHHVRQTPDCVRTVGAGGLATSGTDMARFMIAHLESGVYEGRRIMRAETMDRMHARQFAPHEGLSGWAYGFWEDVRDGRRGLMHDGGGTGSRALIYLLPDRRLGFFLAYNLADRHRDGELLDAFRSQFLHTYVPVPAGRNAIVDAVPLPNVGGYYRYVRGARTTMEKFVSVGNIIRIEQKQNGVLAMTAAGANPVTLVAIGPGLFRRTDDRGVVAFDAVNENGPQRLIVDGGGLRMYERVGVLSTPLVQGMWLLGMAAAFAWAAFVNPVSQGVIWIRRHGERAPGLDSATDPLSLRLKQWTAWLVGIASALNLLFIAGFPLAFLGDLSGGLPRFVYGVPRAALLLLAIPPVTAALAVVSSITVGFMWRDPRHRLVARVEYAIVCAALLAFVPFTVYWRLMGIHP
jgi:CubicO group peptidase (beta-lactamase class C family)